MTATPSFVRKTPSQRAQRGVAAIEFAAVFVVLFFVLYGIATFGAALYTQQVVSRAAEDGARAAPFQPKLLAPATRAEAMEEIRNVVRDSLASSFIVPSEHNGTPVTRRAWIADKVNVLVTPPNPTVAVTITVTYPYSANRLLPSLPLLDTSRWMPDNLTSHATAALQS